MELRDQPNRMAWPEVINQVTERANVVELAAKRSPRHPDIRNYAAGDDRPLTSASVPEQAMRINWGSWAVPPRPAHGPLVESLKCLWHFCGK